jgi:hydrogenase maturation protease
MKNDTYKTLVLGLGNPILSDDGVGCHVAVALKERLQESEADILETSIAGLDFLDLMTGYDRAIIIDAIRTVAGTPGQIYRLAPEALKATRHAASPHDVNLATALELGYKLGLDLPSHVDIFAVEVADTSRFGEECTPEVAAAIPRCAEIVVQELRSTALKT